MKQARITLKVGGMTCVSCQKKIETELRKTAGVKSAQVSLSKSAADIAYNPDVVCAREIMAVIKKLGYDVPAGKGQPAVGRAAAALAAIAALFALTEHTGVLNMLAPSHLADSSMGYGMLFFIGLLTSVHCVAMCGGINLSQSLPRGREGSRASTYAPALMYNLGRVASYTAVGAVLGFAGMLLGGGAGAGIPVMAQGMLKLAAGVYMVIMGINMLGIFPWMKKLQLKMPQLSARAGAGKSPLAVGLLNGLMPCGPLQSMQIVALASASPLLGALAMLLFSLGTVPLMLGLGAAVWALGKRFAKKVMNVGAVLVAVLGLAMLSQGVSLSGLLPPERLLPAVLALCAAGAVSVIPLGKKLHSAALTAAALCMTAVVLFTWSAGGGPGSSAQMADGWQQVSSTLSPGRYPDITVQAGTSVKWTIEAPQGSVNGCNNRLNINEYGISNYTLKTGENVIEFTPEKTGTFRYSCWMGMIRGTITVVQ